MSNILTLELEHDYPEIFGIISDLAPWKMCFLLSNYTGLELTHEDALDKAGAPIQLIQNSNLYAFERYLWASEDDPCFLSLINNKLLVDSPVDKSKQTGSLFQEDDRPQKSIHLLDEWNYVNYLLRTEGLEEIFDPFGLKNIPGIRMVISSTADQFKNYEKVI